MVKSGVMGAASDLEFAVECIKRGAIVSRPLTSAPYDLMVESKGTLKKVKVSTAHPEPDDDSKWALNTAKRKQKAAGDKLTSKVVAYTDAEIDCIVTNAAGVWFFFAKPSRMPDRVQVQPRGTNKACTWNYGKEDWTVVGL